MSATDLNFFLPDEDAVDRLAGLALGVADREQGGVGVADHVGLGVLGRAVGLGGGTGGGRLGADDQGELADLPPQLGHDPLGGRLADARVRRQHLHVLVLDRPRQLADRPHHRPQRLAHARRRRPSRRCRRTRDRSARGTRSAGASSGRPSRSPRCRRWCAASIGSPSLPWTCRRVCSGIRTSISNGSTASVSDSSATASRMPRICVITGPSVLSSASAKSDTLFSHCDAIDRGPMQGRRSRPREPSIVAARRERTHRPRSTNSPVPG